MDLSGNVSKLSAAAGHSLALRTYVRTRVPPLCASHADIAERGQVGHGASGFVYSHPDSLRGDSLSFSKPLGFGFCRILILFDQVRWQQSHHLRPFFLPRARLSLLLLCAQSDAISVAPLLVPGDADCIL